MKFKKGSIVRCTESISENEGGPIKYKTYKVVSHDNFWVGLEIPEYKGNNNSNSTEIEDIKKGAPNWREDCFELVSDSNTKEEFNDVVVKPPHYTQGKIEVLDFLEDQKLDFRLSNTIKYVCRHQYKGKPLEDLKKARFYLDRVIKELEDKNET